MPYLKPGAGTLYAVSGSRSASSPKPLPIAPAERWRYLLNLIRPRTKDRREGANEFPLHALESNDDIRKQGYVMSGGLRTNDVCSVNVHREACTTGSCSTRSGQKSLDMYQEPLHRSPGPNSTLPADRKRATVFSISSDIRSFGEEVDTRFLTPLAREVLHCLQLLVVPTTSLNDVLMQLGEEAFWMSSKDAAALEQIDWLVTSLTIQQKERILKDLYDLLSPQQRYPLYQVLAYGTRVELRKADLCMTFDNDSLINLYSGSDDLTPEWEGDMDEVLKPAPLRFRRRGQGGFHGQAVLTPYPEAIRPAPRPKLQMPHKPLPPIPDIEDANVPESIGEAHKGFSASYSLRRKPLPIPLDLRHQQSSTQPVAQERSANGPGSVSRARANLLAGRRLPPPSKAPITLHLRDDANEPGKVAGSVKRALEGLRSAPVETATPPDVVAKLRGQRPAEESAQQLGSVRRALDNLQLRTGYEPSLETRVADWTNPYRTHDASSKTDLANDAIGLRGGVHEFDNSQPLRSIRDEVMAIKRSYASGHEPEAIFLQPSPAHSLTIEDDPAEYRTSTRGIIMTRRISVSKRESTAQKHGLRGGGGDGEARSSAIVSTNKQPRRRNSSIFGRVPPLAENERPPSAVWWLAGGRAGGGRRVPTAGELRERRAVEEANRNIVGFWGTVLGVRAVRRMSVALLESPVEVLEAGNEYKDADEAGKTKEKVAQSDSEKPAA